MPSSNSGLWAACASAAIRLVYGASPIGTSDAMRILMIIPQAFYTTRGTPLSAYHRTKELIDRGHEVDILTYKVGDDPPDLPARVYRSRGPHFQDSIEAGPSRIKIWFDILLLANLLVRLMMKRYDLVYAHEEGAF